MIALVITIVVLIILAGVAISLSLSNNGLFNKAKEAKEKYQNAQGYEEEQIAKISNQIDDYVNSSRDNIVSYSTKEQEIGTWLNGEKLYRKVYKQHYDSLSKKTIYYIEDEIKGTDVKIQRTECYLHLSTGEVRNISNWTGYDWSCYDANGFMFYLSSDFSNADVVAILEYTK